MDSFIIIKKTIQSHTLYFYEVFLENFPIMLQSLMAISLGIYFNSMSNEFTLPELMTYYLGVIIINTFQRNVALRELEDEISKGVVSNYLTKPINFIYYKILKQFASKLYNVVINFTVILLVILLFFATPLVTPIIILRAIMILPLTIFYFYMIMAIFMYLCLLLEKASDLYRIFGMSAFFLGGGLVPMSNFPAFFNYFPQQFLFGAPLGFITNGIYPYWGLGLIYLFIFILLILVLHKYTMRRLETNGG